MSTQTSFSVPNDRSTVDPSAKLAGVVDASAPMLAHMRLLVVEDDPGMASFLSRALTKQGYSVVMASTGEDALWNAMENDFDAVILDVMIPAPDGYEVLRSMRAHGRWAPVLMLTARVGVPDRVAGLDAGADDYLTKPFALAELLARLRALTRSAPRERPVVLVVGDLTLDPVSREVHRGQDLIPLSPKEFSLLEELMRHSGEVLSRTYLLDHVWDFAYDGDSNVIDVYVRYLRNKIDRPWGRATLQTVRGVGYRISEFDQDDSRPGGPADSEDD